MFLIGLIATSRAIPCVDYESPEEVIDFDAGVEASGLAASALRPGVFFTHGDKDDPDVLVSFDASGMIEEHEIRHATNHDWEDVAAAPCPNPSDGRCLFVGDIGGSTGVDDEVEIYVIREPEAGEVEVEPLETWDIDVPYPIDAETLLVHPLTGEVTIITKDIGHGTVFRLTPDHSEFEAIDEVDVDHASGGAWDPTGERVVLRDRHQLYVWDVDPSDPDGQWNEDPLEVHGHTETAGEAVTFTAEGELYSLGAEQPLLEAFYPCILEEVEEDEAEDEDEDQDEGRGAEPAEEPPPAPAPGPSLSRTLRVPFHGCIEGGGVPGPLVGGVFLLATVRRRRPAGRK